MTYILDEQFILEERFILAEALDNAKILNYLKEFDKDNINKIISNITMRIGDKTIIKQLADDKKAISNATLAKGGIKELQLAIQTYITHAKQYFDDDLLRQPQFKTVKDKFNDLDSQSNKIDINNEGQYDVLKASAEELAKIIESTITDATNKSDNITKEEANKQVTLCKEVNTIATDLINKLQKTYNDQAIEEAINAAIADIWDQLPVIQETISFDIVSQASKPLNDFNNTLDGILGNAESQDWAEQHNACKSQSDFNNFWTSYFAYLDNYFGNNIGSKLREVGYIFTGSTERYGFEISTNPFLAIADYLKKNKTNLFLMLTGDDFKILGNAIEKSYISAKSLFKLPSAIAFGDENLLLNQAYYNIKTSIDKLEYLHVQSDAASSLQNDVSEFINIFYINGNKEAGLNSISKIRSNPKITAKPEKQTITNGDLKNDLLIGISNADIAKLYIQTALNYLMFSKGYSKENLEKLLPTYAKNKGFIEANLKGLDWTAMTNIIGNFKFRETEYSNAQLDWLIDYCLHIIDKNYTQRYNADGKLINGNTNK